MVDDDDLDAAVEAGLVDCDLRLSTPSAFADADVP